MFAKFSPDSFEGLSSSQGIAQPPTWKFDHLGHVVRDLNDAAKFYTNILNFTEIEKESLKSPAIDIVFLELQGFTIELMAPRDDTTVLSKFLERRGPGLHHVCYRVPSVSEELAAMQRAGVELIDATPRPGSRGLQIAFLRPQSTHGVLIELCGSK